MITAIILIDLTKGFDSLSHNLLLCKLQDLAVGTSESSTKWFESYLTERSHNSYRLSFPLPACYGVPQDRFSVPYCSSLTSSVICQISSQTAKLNLTWTILSCFFPLNRLLTTWQ